MSGDDMNPKEIAKRAATNFLIFAVFAFVLWILAAILDRLAQVVGLSSPERLAEITTSIASSATLQAIVSIWLLTAAVAIAFPRFWSPLSTTTSLMFDMGYGILGALTGFGLAIGFFSAHWNILIWALIYSAVIAIGYIIIRKSLPRLETGTTTKTRFIIAAVLFVAAPLVLIWS